MWRLYEIKGNFIWNILKCHSKLLSIISISSSSRSNSSSKKALSCRMDPSIPFFNQSEKALLFHAAFYTLLFIYCLLLSWMWVVVSPLLLVCGASRCTLLLHAKNKSWGGSLENLLSVSISPCFFWWCDTRIWYRSFWTDLWLST